MKTKLLTICLLLFTTQVFATEIGIKCKNLNTKSYNLWKYIETPTKKKIQIKADLEWVDWESRSWYIPKLESETKIEVEIKDKAARILTTYYVKGKIDDRLTHYIDFEIPSSIFTNEKNPALSHSVEYKFLN